MKDAATLPVSLWIIKTRDALAYWPTLTFGSQKDAESFRDKHTPSAGVAEVRIREVAHKPRKAKR